MKFLNVFNLSVAVLFIFASCSSEILDTETRINRLEVHEEKEVNYLIYMAADNNLERFGIKNIKSLQEVGSDENANIIVLFDRSPGYDKSEDNRTGTDLFFITKNPSKMNDDIIFEYGELDMTDSENLYEFLVLADKYFPSRHTVLNLWSHGRGVYPDGIILSGTESRSVIEDYTTGYGAEKTMAVSKLAECLKEYEKDSGKSIYIVQFDCCDMQMIEVSYELKDAAKFVVGSECESPGFGCDYKGIAEYLNTCSDFDAELFSQYLVESFYEYYSGSNYDFSYAYVNTENFEYFIPTFNLFCEELSYNIKNDFTHFSDIVSIRESLLSTDSSYSEFIDLWEFLNSPAFVVYSSIEALKNHFKLLVPECVLSEKYKNSFGGIGINFPHTKNERKYYFKSESDYKILDFYQDSYWDEFLSVF